MTGLVPESERQQEDLTVHWDDGRVPRFLYGLTRREAEAKVAELRMKEGRIAIIVEDYDE